MAKSVSGDANTRELIAFRVGRQEFCINVMAVREIRGWTAATALPRAPHYVRGVINLRGAVLPIVELAVRLGLPSNEPSARNVIIVVQIASDLVKTFVKGLLPVEGRMISLISLDHVLPPSELEAA